MYDDVPFLRQAVSLAEAEQDWARFLRNEPVAELADVAAHRFVLAPRPGGGARSWAADRRVALA